MSTIPERLYQLLPSFYRANDLAQGEPLRALLGILETELQAVRDDVDGLYDNWFIETCDPWVVAYLGDLVGADALPSILPGTDSGRAYVANTIGFRRRKGTFAAVASVVGDVSTWPALGVELFRVVAAHQALNHQRPQNLRTPSLRQNEVLRLLGTPFDPVAHTADVRRPAKYSLNNIGIFIWRLTPYPVSAAPAAAAGPPGASWFNVLGRDTPLFSPIRTLSGGIALTEATAPGPLGPVPLSEALEATRQALALGAEPPGNPYFGNPPAFQMLRTLPELLGDPHLTKAALYASGAGDPSPASITSTAGGLQVQTGTVLNPGSAFGGLVEAVPSGEMAPAHLYSISCSLKTLNGAATLRFSNQSGAGDENALSHTIAATATWTQYTFTAALDVPKSQLYVWSAEAGRQFLIDDLTIQEVPTGSPLGLQTLAPPPAGAPSGGALVPVPPEEIVVAALGGWQAPPSSKTYGSVTLPITAAVDPVLGRVVLASGLAVSGALQVSYQYGFSGEVGGGFYDRSETLASAPTPVPIAGGGAPSDPIVPAFAQASSLQAVVQISDSLVYAPAPLSVPSGASYVLQAANKQRPLLRTTQPWSITLAPGASLTLNGLLLASGLTVTTTGPATLTLVHCTLVPGTVLGAGSGPLTLTLTSAITGAVQLHPLYGAFSAQDSVIDGTGGQAVAAGPAATFTRCTVLGAAVLGSLAAATDTLFCGALTLASTATGSVSTSFVPDGTAAPGSLAASGCQPALALRALPGGTADFFGNQGLPASRAAVVARVQPSFTSTTYGDPGYAQLRSGCAPEILTGGSNQSEMGVFHDLYQPQMQANVISGLSTYLRLGLSPTLFFVT